jgi:hypothetical protein
LGQEKTHSKGKEGKQEERKEEKDKSMENIEQQLNTELALTN